MPISECERDEEFPRGYKLRNFYVAEAAAEIYAEAHPEPIEAAEGGSIDVEWIQSGSYSQEVAVLRMRDKEGDIVAEAVLLGWQARDLADLLRR